MSSELEDRARVFGAERHAGQRYGDQPYTVHLAAVRAVLASIDAPEHLCVAAWLHDTIEDTGAAYDELHRLFGDDVAEVVWAVTGQGHSRKARNVNAYEKIRRRGDDAATLKLADRIANVEASKRTAPEKLAMYRKEHCSFSGAIRGFGDDRLWERLDALLEST